MADRALYCDLWLEAQWEKFHGDPGPEGEEYLPDDEEEIYRMCGGYDDGI